jgi:hypothetical protein
MVGHSLSLVQIVPGQALPVDIVWQATEPMTQAYTSFLHLLDVNRQRVTGDDRQAWGGLYPTTRWSAGEMVRIGYTLTLPADLPPGLYTLSTGWYDAAQNRLRTPDGTDQVALAEVVVPAPEAGSPLPFPADGRFDGGIRLAEYDLVQEPAGLKLTLGWETAQFIDKDYAVFVHLRDGAGSTVSQGDGPPLSGSWPTSLWPEGYPLRDSHLVPLPAKLPAGQYTLVVGLYDPRTGQRVPLAAGGDEFSLTTIPLP